MTRGFKDDVVSIRKLCDTAMQFISYHYSSIELQRTYSSSARPPRTPPPYPFANEGHHHNNPPASSLFSHPPSFLRNTNALVYSYRMPLILYMQTPIMQITRSFPPGNRDMDITIVAKRMGRVVGRATGIKPWVCSLRR